MYKIRFVPSFTDIYMHLAVKESLNKDGKLGKFKAELRSAVMSVLNRSPNNPPPQIPDETKLVNDLIREYLSWNGYLYAEQIFSTGELVNLVKQVFHTFFLENF